MLLKNIMAIPHSYGNRIDLKWINPDPVQFPGMRVMRLEGTHPISPTDGVVVAEGVGLHYAVNEKGEGLYHAVDENLKGETVYYYTLFPYKGDPPECQIDLHNRASAMATAPYNIAGQMYDLLPAIYHRYDTVLPKIIPAGMLEEDKKRGQLRRFLDLPGSQLDQCYSFAKAMLDLHNLNKVDGRLLPLLAQWIGWKIDYNLEIEAQRNEIRNAPAVYKTIGIIPTVEATVKRISGWESRIKEFVHNVFLSNRPERLNIWVHQRSSTGEWLEPPEPLSLNFAYEGRPTAVREADGTVWFFYHTLKKGQWDIWYKTYRDDREPRWAPSQPFTNRAEIDKYPTTVIQGGTLWVFWSTHDEKDQMWHINYLTRTGGVWSVIKADEPFADNTNERKKPWAVVDNTGGLWLFWLEKVGSRWQMKYNRHNGTTWDTAKSFPLDAGVNPRVESDLFVLFHPTNVNQRIWVFWARKEPAGEPDQTRWQVVYRVKQSIDPSASDWGTVRTLPKVTSDHHDREPAAIVAMDGNVELFWSSTRDGSWSVWRNILDIAAGNWGTPALVTTNLYSQRDPLPVSIDAFMLLIYRSNESLSYTSRVYSATKTVDFRYAGSTTVHTRNDGKIDLHGKFEDFQTYTYDTGKNGGRTNEDWYARDTIGLYLTPDTTDAEEIEAGISRVGNILVEFMPMADRAVLFTQ